MISISLTDLVDVVSKAGTPKLTKISQIKNRPDYHPSSDFYKNLRDKIVEIHKSNGNRFALRNIINSTDNPKKIPHYDAIINGYNKWWGKKEIEWFTPPKVKYEHAGVEVTVNPELGLIIDGQRYIIKMYLKDEKLDRNRIEIVTTLMDISLPEKSLADDVLGVLDVRNSKLYRVGQYSEKTKFLIDAELLYIADLFNKL